MRKQFIYIFFVLSLIGSLASCDKETYERIISDESDR